MGTVNSPGVGFDDKQRWNFDDTLHGLLPTADFAYSHGSVAKRALINAYPVKNILTNVLAGSALHTSTTATDILGTAVGGSKTIAAGELNAIGRAINFDFGGVHGTTGTPNITVEVLLGTTPILTTGVVATVAVTGPLAWNVRGRIQVVTTGATGTVNGYGSFLSNVTSFAVTAVSGAAVTLDLTAAQAVKLRVTWGTSNSANTITCVCGTIGLELMSAAA